MNSADTSLRSAFRWASATAGPEASIPTTDLAPSSALYADVQLALSLGVVALDDAGKFDVSGEVSGEEAVNAVVQLFERLREKTG